MIESVVVLICRGFQEFLPTGFCAFGPLWLLTKNKNNNDEIGM
jgi:hypothetical protein